MRPSLPAHGLDRRSRATPVDQRATRSDTSDTIRTRIYHQLQLQQAGNLRTMTEQRTRLELERTKAKLVDMALSDAIPLDELKRRQDLNTAEITDATRQLALASADQKVAIERLEIALRLLTHCDTLYIGSPEHSRRLLNQAVYKRLHVDVNEIVGHEHTPPFACLRAVPEPPATTNSTQARTKTRTAGSKKAATRNQRKNTDPCSRDRCSDVDHLAEGVGFEPTVNRGPQRLSRPPHSSALATLRSGR